MGPVAFVTLCLLGCLVCSPALAGLQAAPCPEGWKDHKGECYGFFAQERTWQDAESMCQEQGAGTHLASIHNKGETDFLAGYVKQHPAQNRPVWIGLWDPSHEYVWKWADRSPVDYLNWAPVPPDPLPANESCVGLEEPEFTLWHDYYCNSTFAFICEQQSRRRKRHAPGAPPAPGQ